MKSTGLSIALPAMPISLGGFARRMWRAGHTTFAMTEKSLAAAQLRAAAGRSEVQSTDADERWWVPVLTTRDWGDPNGN
jgi:hypothetical protein